MSFEAKVRMFSEFGCGFSLGLYRAGGAEVREKNESRTETTDECAMHDPGG